MAISLRYFCPKVPLQINLQLYAIHHIAPDKFVNVCKQTAFILASWTFVLLFCKSHSYKVVGQIGYLCLNKSFH